MDNNWYEEGELPPVNSICLVNWSSCLPDEKALREYFNNKEVKIISHDSLLLSDGLSYDLAVFRINDIKEGSSIQYYSLVRSCFKPFKSEKDKTIEEARKVWNDHLQKYGNTWNSNVFDVLYDAGLLKNKE